MKTKPLVAIIFSFLISNIAYSQDTSSNQRLSENQTYHVTPSANPNNNMTGVMTRDSTTKITHHIYRPTRLGSSSPLYNTYEKNDYGAGAITTNPNKSGGGSFTPPPTMNQAPADTNYDNVNVYDTANKR